MVKFKSRYLLIEVLYEDNKLQKHDTSKFAKIIKNEVEKNFGEISLGKINKNLQIKYVNNYTNMLIVRVGKEYIKLMRAAIVLINKIDYEKVRLRIIGISGTIKGAEKRATKFLEDFVDNSNKIFNKSKNEIDNKDEQKMEVKE